MLYKLRRGLGLYNILMITEVVKLAKLALSNVDRMQVMALLDAVNLTKQERDIVQRTELEGERLADMADLYSLSIDSVSLIKRQALRKIGIYLTQKLG
jgi:DNA-directed RNA polymerase specialized sigma24 family protein